MLKKPFILLLSMLLLVAITGCAANKDVSKQDDPFPSKPIKIVVTYAAGGGSDMVARVISSFLSDELKVPVIVENIPGGGTLTGGKYVSDAEPDGYTICLGGMDIIVAPLVNDEHKGAGYGQDSYQPLVQIGEWPHIMAVKNEAPWDSFEEFINDARENPGEITYATAAAGGIYHINLELLKQELDVDITHVPFDGSSEALMAVAGGHIDAVAAGEVTIAPLHEGGILRPLVIMSDQKVDGWDDVPSFGELGIDLHFSTSRLVVAPAGVPKERLEILERAFLNVLANEDFLSTAGKIGEDIAPLNMRETEELYNRLYNDMRPVIRTVFGLD